MTTPVDPPKDPAATPADAKPAALADNQPTDFGDDTEKWKHFSRQNEAAAKKAQGELSKKDEALQAALKELDELKKAGMTDAEKALADAKVAARAEALNEVSGKLAAAALLAAGAKEGVDLSSEVDDLNLAKFIKDGDVDTEAVASYVARQKGRKPRGRSAGELGMGQQSDAPKGQVTEAELKRMTPEQIVKAQNEGRLNHLLGVD